jgi:hexosaminidase
LNLAGHYTEKEVKAITSKLGTKARNFNGTTRYELGGSDFGYKYDISFDLNPSTGNKADAILFQSYFSKLVLNTGGTGKLGFTRDGYTFTFNYLPTTDTWQTIRLTGDWKGVTLYVDGRLIEQLTIQHNGKFNVHRTLFFPLEAAGDATNGFKGQLKNLILAR